MSADSDSSDLGWQLPAVSSSLALSGGVLKFSRPQQMTEVVEPGLKLVLVLAGRITYELRDSESVQVRGPSLHLSLSDDPFTMRHHFDTAAPLQFIAVRMQASTLHDEFGVDAARLKRGLDHRDDSVRRLIVERPAGRAVTAIGHQMLLCPMQDAMRGMYLAGKALELTATVMADITNRDAGNAATPLAARDVRLLREARDLLLQRLQDPPTLQELARLAGTNVNKLTIGFRRLFGTSVYGFVREQRLELAYRLLATGQISAAEAAHSCGYTNSHFTKAFRKRFGIVPSALH